MAKASIKLIMSELSSADIIHIIVTAGQWLAHDAEHGCSDLSDEQIRIFKQEMESVNEKMKEDLEALTEGNEREEIFKSGLADVVRTLRGAQRDRNSERLNDFFASRLRPNVLEVLYSAAGINRPLK